MHGTPVLQYQKKNLKKYPDVSSDMRRFSVRRSQAVPGVSCSRTGQALLHIHHTSATRFTHGIQRDSSPSDIRSSYERRLTLSTRMSRWNTLTVVTYSLGWPRRNWGAHSLLLPRFVRLAMFTLLTEPLSNIRFCRIGLLS